MLDVIFLIIGVFIFIKFLSVLLKSQNPLRKAVLSMLSGICSLVAASLVTGFFGASLAVNLYTVFIALTLGIPGVILLILKIFII